LSQEWDGKEGFDTTDSQIRHDETVSYPSPPRETRPGTAIALAAAEPVDKKGASHGRDS